jgi:CheY-like chemotaxis protein
MATILIVEDHPDLAQLFALWAKLAGRAAEICSTGFEALQLLPKLRPCAVVLDLGLPGMDGWEVARAIRRNLMLKQPMLIAVSAFSSVEDVERSTRSGIDLHFSKPLDFQTFREILEKIAEAPVGSEAAIAIQPISRFAI